MRMIAIVAVTLLLSACAYRSHDGFDYGADAVKATRQVKVR